MTMTISLPESLAAVVRAEVLSGHFRTPDEVVAASIALMTDAPASDIGNWTVDALRHALDEADDGRPAVSYETVKARLASARSEH